MIKKIDLATLNIIDTCVVKVANFDTGKWETVGRCPNTPRHIAELWGKSKRKERSFWVFDGSGKYLAKIKDGLAVRM